MSKSNDPDAYGRLSYRHLIDWGPRIEREAPFLRRCLEGAPERRVVDLGCGTGEHAAFLASEGWDVLGVDHSAPQITAAREHEREGLSLRFAEGRLEELPQLSSEDFGAAVCLGNVLSSLHDDSLAATLDSVAERLRPGAPFLLQLLNTQRLIEKKIRHLPLNFRPDPEGEAGDEILFLRLLRPRGDRALEFRAVTLAVPQSAEEPVELRQSEEVVWRAWQAPELVALLEAKGFESIVCYGGMKGEAFEVETSHDLVVHALRSGTGRN